MCTDYTNLNKACLKEAYLLPSIYKLVDGAAGHKVMSFLDAYSGYNQIPMHEADKSKTAFMTDKIVKSKNSEQHAKDLEEIFS